MIRLFDFVLAFLGLVFGFPVLLTIYIFGLFDTGAPLFCQKRVGKKKKPFT
ncbi:sugar transferase, partial [Thalassotalea sp. G20_0]|uniref:sugar transferase n=1 Tax=Thalassotalea sp. G20_0 TaxID=2821093 RepID=UPI001ADA7684|nr:sugar transferase [Thalassotalea sp. G20_0]